MQKELYITGAGVSSRSGIPTFRGSDGFWTVGSKNYTPQEMATRKMYMARPDEFLLWYYKRFAKYRHSQPNEVHKFLVNKKLITQNIDGLDEKAGNKNFIPIHGNLHKITFFHEEDTIVDVFDAPWDIVNQECPDIEDNLKLKKVLLNIFKISSKSLIPDIMVSLKPYVLLFDEYYTNNYKIEKAETWINEATCLTFLGTSFSVNITNIALTKAINNNAKIKVVDPSPVDLGLDNILYFKMTASEYISESRDNK